MPIIQTSAGIVSQNSTGKQVALPATTAANSAYAYTFSSGSTATLGSLTLTSQTTTYTGGQAWVKPSYDSTTGIMTFNGTTQSLGYVANASLHVSPLPFSAQIDFNPTLGVHSYIMNLGQGFNRGYPEIIIDLATTGNLTCVYHTANTAGSANTLTFGKVSADEWNRVGLMCWSNSGTNTIRGYLNGEIRFQATMTGLPWTSTAGISFGNDNANYASTFYKGQMRNIFIGKTQFWT